MTTPRRAAWPYRVPVGVKLATLLVVSTVVVIFDRWWLSALLLVASLAVLVAAGLSWRRIATLARPFLLFALAIAAFQLVLGRYREALLSALRLLAVALAAVAVTATTRTTEIVAWVERTLRRLRVPEPAVFRVGLTVGIALRSIEYLGVVAMQVLDARRARGLQRSLRAFATPTVVAAARFAHGVGEALDARGIVPPAEREDGGQR